MSCSSRKPGKQPLGPDALTEEKELLKLENENLVAEREVAAE
jgi:hypothetical protein